MSISNMLVYAKYKSGICYRFQTYYRFKFISLLGLVAKPIANTMGDNSVLISIIDMGQKNMLFHQLPAPLTLYRPL
jgi:hypothetical protein